MYLWAYLNVRDSMFTARSFQSVETQRGVSLLFFASQSSQRTQSFLIRFPERGNLITLLSRSRGRSSSNWTKTDLPFKLGNPKPIADKHSPPTADGTFCLVPPLKESDKSFIISAPSANSSDSGRETLFSAFSVFRMCSGCGHMLHQKLTHVVELSSIEIQTIMCSS